MKNALGVALILSLTHHQCVQEGNANTQPIEESTPVQQVTNDFPLDTIDTSATYLMGHFDPAQHEGFELVDKNYADREGLYLRKDTYRAFKKMWKAAQDDGIALVIRSATRNFDYQKGIWERKWTGQTNLEDNIKATTMADYRERALAILRYSSMPGSSRHHWGTDIDLNSFSNDYFKSGQGKKEYDWLVANGPSFGFCQPYTAKGPDRPHGYEEERWHWSYFPVSAPLTDAARHLSDQQITGFKGAETSEQIGIRDHYILGISDECFPKNQQD